MLQQVRGSGATCRLRSCQRAAMGTTAGRLVSPLRGRSFSVAHDASDVGADRYPQGDAFGDGASGGVELFPRVAVTHRRRCSSAASSSRSSTPGWRSSRRGGSVEAGSPARQWWHSRARASLRRPRRARRAWRRGRCGNAPGARVAAAASARPGSIRRRPGSIGSSDDVVELHGVHIHGEPTYRPTTPIRWRACRRGAHLLLARAADRDEQPASQAISGSSGGMHMATSGWPVGSHVVIEVSQAGLRL